MTVEIMGSDIDLICVRESGNLHRFEDAVPRNIDDRDVDAFARVAHPRLEGPD